jgi:hypothetical protein
LWATRVVVSADGVYALAVPWGRRVLGSVVDEDRIHPPEIEPTRTGRAISKFSPHTLDDDIAPASARQTALGAAGFRRNGALIKDAPLP